MNTIGDMPTGTIQKIACPSAVIQSLKSAAGSDGENLCNFHQPNNDGPWWGCPGFEVFGCGHSPAYDQCAAGGNTPPPPPTPPSGQCSTSRCGITWNQANEECGKTCTVNDDCPGMQGCQGKLACSPCTNPAPSPPTPPPPARPSGECSTSRCGITWNQA